MKKGIVSMGRTRVYQWLCLASLLIPAIAVWWPSIFFDFINWDDPSYVLNNSLIVDWSPRNLIGVATETVTRNYAPITIFSYLIDHTIWGLKPQGYHLSNLIGHCICGVLVFVLVRRLTGSQFVAWTTAMLFLVHPVQVETVVWVSSRKGILSGIFMLWALVIRLRPDAEARHDAWYIVLLICALLSKALAVVLPPIVLLYDLWVRKEKFSDAIVKQVIPGLLSLMLLMYTTGAQNSVMGGVRTHMSLSLLHILAVDVVILWQYIFMMLRPSELCVLYDPPTQGIALQVALGLLGWILVCGWIWRKRSEHPLLIWGAATYLLLLFPVLNFFRITTLMNDRYLYLPCIVFFAAVATLFERSVQWMLREKRAALRGSVLQGVVLGLCAITVVAGASWKTREYMPVWSDSEKLWVYAMEKVPSLAVVRIQMALTLHDRGRSSEAAEVLRSALRECEVDDLDRRRIERQLQLYSSPVARDGVVTTGAGS